MSRVSASKALAYATGDEMLKLYGVLVGGWLLTFMGQFVLQTTFNAVLSLVSVIVALAGAVAVLVGVVAIAYKLLADGRVE
jgi:hypothetical protein